MQIKVEKDHEEKDAIIRFEANFVILVVNSAILYIKSYEDITYTLF